MKRYLLVIFFIPMMLTAQLMENFSDGDFTQNPVWAGTSDKYQVNTSFQLQLNAAEAGTAYLSTPYSNPGGNLEWRFWIRLNFSPSGSNYSDVFLSSDQADLNSALNGYFLRFGEAGSSDAIELFRKQGTQNTSVMRGSEALVATSFALFVKVIRSETGQWTLLVDQTGSGIYTLEASGSDNTFQPGGYFGFVSQFTVSNASKMYYDDISISPEVIDNLPPTVLNANANDPFTIEVTFNEAVSSESLINTANYILDQGIGQPAMVLQGASAAKALLQLGTAMENGVVYNLLMRNIQDLNENTMADTSVLISYYEAQANDVVINEIMADPSPVVGLPEWEFIELHNNTNIPINLEGWKLMIGTGERIIGAVSIQPKDFLILGHENASQELSVYGDFFGFSSFQLANSGASLSLLGKQGQLVAFVAYSDSWYNDNTKKEGGWTLEQKDPTNPCGGNNNWTASNHADGGTPGSQNSVFAISTAGPRPQSQKLIGNNILQIWFDQQMDAVSMGNTQAYLLNPGSLNPSSATPNPADPAFVELEFSQPFESGLIYTLEIGQSILNCAGRAVEAGTAIEFGLPDTPQQGDVVINEILFNPLTGSNDFVELYNRSNKIINLEDLRLGAIRQTIPNPADTSLREIISSTSLMLPQTYVLLTTDTAGITQFYHCPSTENFIAMSSFPTYANEAGTVLLVNKSMEIIDQFSYTEKMHFPLLNYVKGVSLERISPERPASDLTNWHSASETAGFATPGYQNSMFVQDVASTTTLETDPEIFSPDGDGYADVTSIRYLFEEAGNTLNIHIFNASGLKVRHLLKSMLVSQEGAVSWDGLDDQARKLPSGIYIIHAEIFRLDGTVEHLKKAVVMATR